MSVPADQDEDKAMSGKKGSNFSIGRLTTFCKSGRFAERIGAGTPIYLSAVHDYITAEVLLAAAEQAKLDGKKRIKPRHIMLAIRKDQELAEFFRDAHFMSAGVVPTETSKPNGKKKKKVDDDSDDYE